MSPTGQRAAGVKALTLKENEFVVNGFALDSSSETRFLTLVTQRGAMKRMSLAEFEVASRAKRGQIMLRELKRKPHRVVGLIQTKPEETVHLLTESGEIKDVNPMELTVSDRYSNGSFVLDTDETGEVTNVWINTEYETPFKID